MAAKIISGKDVAAEIRAELKEETAKLIDIEVRKIVEKAQKDAEEILVTKKDQLELLANALLEFEILDAGEIEKILNGEEIVKEVDTQVIEEKPETTETVIKEESKSSEDDAETTETK